MILGIETTADVCSVAVVDENGILVERAFRHRMHLSERLIADVDAALQDSGSSLEMLDGLGVGIGPGSFTGVRIGVTTVKTWADVLQKPVAGIISLDVLAQESAVCAECAIVPIIRAKPGSVYSAVYTGREGEAQVTVPIELLTIEELTSRLSSISGPVILCGEGLIRYGTAIREACGAKAQFGSADAPRASTIARMAARRLKAGQADDPLALAPLYVSPPPIDPRMVPATDI